jgi:hypothetical protein
VFFLHQIILFIRRKKIFGSFLYFCQPFFSLLRRANDDYAEHFAIDIFNTAKTENTVLPGFLQGIAESLISHSRGVLQVLNTTAVFAFKRPMGIPSPCRLPGNGTPPQPAAPCPPILLIWLEVDPTSWDGRSQSHLLLRFRHNAWQCFGSRDAFSAISAAVMIGSNFSV